MSRPFILVLAIVAVGVVYVLVPIATDLYRRFRGMIRVTCPETKETASVEVNLKRAVLTGLFGKPHVRLAGCSRWPEREGCAQDCREQIS
jgi:hypothetical protein